MTALRLSVLLRWFGTAQRVGSEEELGATGSLRRVHANVAFAQDPRVVERVYPPGRQSAQGPLREQLPVSNVLIQRNVPRIDGSHYDH